MFFEIMNNQKLLLFFVLLYSSFTVVKCRRTVSPDFDPLELVPVRRYVFGRPYAGDNNLSESVLDDANHYWLKMNAALEDYVTEHQRPILRQWTRNVANNETVKSQVSKRCFRVLQTIVSRPLEQEWSALMIDASGSLPSGVLSTTMADLGDFDQCLAVNGVHEGTAFVGRYCLATVNIPRSPYSPLTFNESLLQPNWRNKYLELWHQLDNRYSLATAICFPSICTRAEVKTVIQSYYQQINSLDFNVTYCQSKEEAREYNPKIWIAVTILAIPSAIVVLSLITDLISPIKKSGNCSAMRKILHCFSPLANTKTLVTINNAKQQPNVVESSNFQFIHGIRTMGALFVCIAHVCALIVNSIVTVLPYSRFSVDFQANMRSIIYQPLFNGGLVVHTFFLLSGLLMTYHGLAKKRKISFLPYIALRYIRYTPVFVASSCLQVSLELFGAGPLFHHDQLMLHLDSCYNYWWADVLYIQNLIPIDTMCNIISWYLGVEMQIHIIAFVLLIAYTRSSRITYFISGGFILIQLLATISVIMSGWAKPSIFHLYAFTMEIFPEWLYNLRVMYLTPFNHFIPYFIGAILGQMLLEKKIIQFSNVTRKLFWTLSIIIIVFLFTGTYLQLQEPTESMTIYLPSTVTTAVLIFTMTCAWSFSNAWIVYNCATVPSNPINQVLSAPIFQPFSRLSFSFYLCHICSLWFTVLQTRSLVSVTFISLLQLVSCSIIMTIFLSYLLFLTFDAPSVRLVKMVIGGKRAFKSVKTNEVRMLESSTEMNVN